VVQSADWLRPAACRWGGGGSCYACGALRLLFRCRDM
jgi:hypothetical protein